MKNKKFLILVAIMLSSVLIVTGCGQTANEPNGNADEKIKITIGKVPYPDMWPATYITQQIAEELGYETEIIEADMGLMYQGLAQGNIKVFPDVCLPNLHQSYVDKYEGQFETVGKIYEEAPCGFSVPTYMDVDSIEDLKGRAADFGARIVGIEPSSGAMMQAEEAMEAYGLDGYELLEGSTHAMLADVKRKTATNEPIIFISWRPHTMWLNFDLKILEDPKDIFKTYDCLFGVNNNLKDDAPDLYNFTKTFSLSYDEIENMIAKIDEGSDSKQVAKDWIQQNRSKVDNMLGK
ncbi:MAG: glycine betaine ABC transporter substrate-binding protein [Desulfitobacteriaceae bacterium]|nr:glycine betaine ABC transporter substrate-binding protein [Desulfitobacteriaceae bacterium]MDD4400664.1 glycine betaine ABC transporter substrate-binding protein [Desulfitobacteriaceae bacterium]